MLTAPADDSGMSPILSTAIAIGFLLFAVIVGGMSVRDYFILQKAAKMKALEDPADESADEDDEDESDDEDDDEYEYEDDEEYEYDDDDDEDDEYDDPNNPDDPL